MSTIILRIITVLAVSAGLVYSGVRWQQSRTSLDLSPSEELQILKAYVTIGLTDPKMQPERQKAMMPVIERIGKAHGCSDCQAHIDGASGWARAILQHVPIAPPAAK